MKLMLINTTTSEPGALIYKKVKNTNNNSESLNNASKNEVMLGQKKENKSISQNVCTFAFNAEDYYRHSESLLPAIEKILSDSELDLFDLSAIAVITGPGSFTGIRVGLATVKAFSAVQKINILSANIFEVLSYYVKNGIVLIQSTNTSYYYGIIENSVLESYGVVDNENLNKFLENKNKRVFCYEHELESLQKSYNDIETINNINNIFYEFFANEYREQRFKDVNEVEPFYIQLSHAERELNKKKEELGK